MAGFMRLRQICLVAPAIEPVVGDIAAIMGLNICYRDGNVAKYGLENALLPVDTAETTGPVGLTTRSGISLGYGAGLLVQAIREVAAELSR